MSRLADEIHGIPPELLNGAGRCKFSAFLSSLDAEDFEAVTMLLNSAMSSASVHRLLRGFGSFGSTTLTEHRGKQCSCYPRPLGSPPPPPYDE